MGLIQLRELLAFPPNPDNSSDTVLNGIHFNLTALQYWNYTLFSNGTLSNHSSCYLIFDDYKPVILSNGTFINGTSCYVPILPLKTRGRVGALFGALFGISIMFTLINLKRHGQQFLRESRRFRLVGRRWQWYWMLIEAACGMISCITAVDVDRDYLQDLALILSSFFFMCMGQSAVAAIWEGIRHWGSWQERQIVDRDPFSLREDDVRGKKEFYMPLVFYFFTFMSFFLTAPRNWSAIPGQGGIEQQMQVAKPVATDGRFKGGGIMLCISWIILVYCAHHNLYYYRLRTHPADPMPKRSIIDVATVIRHLPIRYTLALLVIPVYIAYTIAEAFVFDISVMKYDVAVVWPFALGYTPCVIVLFLFNIWGFIEPNEDKEIIRQRFERGQAADAEIGITKKPSWWSKARGDSHLDDLTQLREMVAETNINSNKRQSRSSIMSTANRKSTAAGAVEMDNLHSQTSSTGTARDANALHIHGAGLRPRSPGRGRGAIIRTRTEQGLLSPTESNVTTWGARRPSSPSATSVASAATGTTLTGERQQHIRSMLDV